MTDFIAVRGKLTVGDKFKFTSETQRYTLQARDGRYFIFTKPFNAQKTYLYTIVDLERKVRGPCNLILGLDVDCDTPSGAGEVLADLKSGELAVSYRKAYPLTERELNELEGVLTYRRSKAMSEQTKPDFEKIALGYYGSLLFRAPLLANQHQDIIRLEETLQSAYNAGKAENVCGLTLEEFGELAREEWEEICSDTDCHPLDIEQLGRRRLSFTPNHWVRQIFDRISQLTQQSNGWCFDMEKAPDHNGGKHLRAVKVYHSKTDQTWWDIDCGVVSDNGDFVNDDGEPFGWQPEDYTAYCLIDLPNEAK